MDMSGRQHGTVAGYWQHYKRKEEICPGCREAQRAYARDLRRSGKGLDTERKRAAKSREAATRGGRAWTRDDDLVVSGPGTNLQKALQLGRSEKAVKHRSAYLRNPPAPKPPKPEPVTCEVDDCEKVAKTRGMCPMHYARFRKYGTPEPHGLNRMGCDCAVCVAAREANEEKLRVKKRQKDAERRKTAEYQASMRARQRSKYQSDEDYRARVLEDQKRYRDERLQENPHFYSEYSRKWKEENPEKWLDLQNRMIAIKRERNRDSLGHAFNHFKEWTGPELELVAREELTIAELSEGLGRTLVSVEHARTKVRKLPREILLAGISRPPRQHGTNAGYWQHYNRREEICEACRAAHREHARQRYARKPKPT